LCDPNIVTYIPRFPEPIKGREAVLKFFEALFKAYPDFETRMLNTVAKGDTVANEAIMVGTFKGPLPTSQGPIPPTGRHFELKFANFGRINPKGLFTEVRYYYDTADYFKQLGLKA